MLEAQHTAKLSRHNIITRCVQLKEVKSILARVDMPEHAVQVIIGNIVLRKLKKECETYV